MATICDLCLHAALAIGALVLLFWLRRRFFKHLLPSKGKVVLVTGCDTPLGFGRAIVRRLNDLGYVVFAGCLDSKPSESLYADLISPSFHVIQLDVTKQSEVEQAKEAIENWLKENPNFQFFGVVNNAGIGVIGPMEWVKMETYHKIFDVNFFGVIRTTQAFVPILRRHGNGRLVVIASLAGEVPSTFFLPYSASKSAVLACFDCLDAELARFGIKVSSILPDFYRTNIIDPEKIAADIDREISGLNSETFEAYGGEKILNCLKKMTKGVSNQLAKPDLTPLVDSVVDALASTCPKRRYYPIDFGTNIYRLIYFVFPSLMKLSNERLMAVFGKD